jgi:hypothetical protein
MFDHRWLPPSQVERLLPERRLKVPGPRWRRTQEKPAATPAPRRTDR